MNASERTDVDEADVTLTTDDQLPREQEAATSPLDALLSPTASSTVDSTVRDSVVEPELNEISLNDDRFSTVPLKSPRQSTTSNVSRFSLSEDRRSNSFSSTRPESSSTGIKRASHKKSLSLSTPGENPGRLSFFMQRLDMQKVKEQEDETSRRTSVEGQHKLQEEFSRLQSESQSENLSTTANGHANIDWDFWGAVMADYRQYAVDHPDPLARAIESGIPPSLRGMMWQLMSASKDLELEATYLQLLKESSSHEKAILRDLGRTFPHHEFFTDGLGIGQENLFNVLKAYSLYDPEVGYCQGLPFVVAVLLLNMPDEEAFCLLVRLMQSYDLRGHFLPEMPQLQLRLYQFDRLIEELLPVLHVHFLRQGIKSSMFCSQWFLTMFSYRFPLDCVFRIYDNVLATGIEAIFGFSVVLLQKNEEALLNLKFDEILAFLKTRLFEQYILQSESAATIASERPLSVTAEAVPIYDVDAFVRDAMQVRITPFMLDAYAHEYADLVRTREAHAVEMDALRNANRQLTGQVKALEQTLATVNAEQCELVKELVMQRIRNEEMEGELVRYKLLYADAMHQNEDALSSHRLSTAFSLRSRSSTSTN